MLEITGRWYYELYVVYYFEIFLSKYIEIIIKNNFYCDIIMLFKIISMKELELRTLATESEKGC